MNNTLILMTLASKNEMYKTTNAICFDNISKPFPFKSNIEELNIIQILCNDI